MAANSPLADYLMHRVDSPRNAFSGGGGFASGSSSSASDALGIPYGLAGLSRPTSSSVTGVDRRPHLLPNDVSMEEVFSAILNGNPSPGRVSTPRNASRKQRTPFRAKSPPGSSSSSGRNVSSFACGSTLPFCQGVLCCGAEMGTYELPSTLCVHADSPPATSADPTLTCHGMIVSARQAPFRRQDLDSLQWPLDFPIHKWGKGDCDEVLFFLLQVQ